MKKIIFLFCLLVTYCELNAQLFTVIESSAKPEYRLDSGRNNIVDINGRLTIQLHTNKITERLAQINNLHTISTASLAKLNIILQNQYEILSQLQTYIPNTAVNKNHLQTVSALMSNFLQAVMREPGIRKAVDSIYIEAYSNGYDTLTYTTTDAYVINKLAVYNNQIANKVQQLQGIGNTKIQLIAFLNTKAEADKKVHIENFDNYKEGSYYEVPRWVSSFSQDDIAVYNQAADWSKKLNSLVNTNFNTLLKQIPDSLNAYACFSGLLSNVQNKSNSLATAGLTNIRNYLNVLVQKINQINNTFQVLKVQKNQPNIATIQQLITECTSFTQTVKSLPITADSLFKNLVSTEKVQVQQIHSELMNCIAIAEKDVVVIRNIYNTLVAFISPFHENAIAVQNATGNAYSLSLNQLPANGFINLKQTGKRENGDELLIKIRIPQAIDSSSWQTLEQQTIELQQINFYSETNIGVILASPIGNSSAVKLTNTFQFAPSGSLLLKFGSRKSRLFNAINPGIGFLMSTPDFDLDGSPDVSYGGVITLLRNVFSLGLSYNTKTNSSFWSFGLSLPFTSLGLPFGGNVQNQK